MNGTIDTPAAPSPGRGRKALETALGVLGVTALVASLGVTAYYYRRARAD